MRPDGQKHDVIILLDRIVADVFADLDAGRALHAAALSREHGLPMADVVIYATARAYRAEVFTRDAHFKGLPGVRFMPG